MTIIYVLLYYHCLNRKRVANDCCNGVNEIFTNTNNLINKIYDN